MPRASIDAGPVFRMRVEALIRAGGEQRHGWTVDNLPSFETGYRPSVFMGGTNNGCQSQESEGGEAG